MIDVITASGKKFQSDYLVTIPTPKMLYVRLLGTTQETVRNVFSDPNETNRLEYGGIEYAGYTKLKSLFDEGDALKVGLEYAVNYSS